VRASPDGSSDAGTPEPAQTTIVHFLGQALLVHLRPYGWQCLLVILTVFVTAGFQIALNLSYVPLIDDAIPNRNATRLVLILALMSTLFLLSSLGDILRDVIAARVGAGVLRDLRLALFEHLQTLTAAFYARAQSGDLVSRVMTDPNAIESAVTDALPQGVRFLLQAVVDLVALFVLDWRLALLMLVVLPLSFYFPRRFARRATEAAFRRREDEGGLSGQVQANLEAQATVRSLDAHHRASAQFAGQLARIGQNIYAANLTERLVIRSSDIGYWLMYLLVIAVGAVQAFRGDLTIGMYMSFVSILIESGASISALSGLLAELVPAAAAQRRIDDLLHETPGVRDAPDARPLARLSHEIRFEQVGFSYAGAADSPALREVSFAVPAGQFVAFVGRNGSGKSSLLSLLLRFYDPQCGRVSIDGCDLRHVNLSSLRAQTGVVLQDAYLFNASVCENLRLARPGATGEQIEQAARLAEIHEFILSLPEGYETMVGERGSRLSGGQRQRLALARALLREPALLLLDEPTSALDPESEAAIHATLRRLMAARDRTIILITHRLDSIRDLDTIFVMDAGRIVEAGSHAGLLARGGLYAELCQIQGGFNVSADGRNARISGARLRAIPLFSEVDEATLNELAGQFVAEFRDAGQVVVAQGEPGDRFYVVVRGRVSASVERDGQVVRSVLQEGDYFGEIALLMGVPRTATVRTLTPCLFLTLARRQFLRMLELEAVLRASIEQAAAGRSLDDALHAGTGGPA
jgi:ATP-binding cassette, subfamily B, bacterial